MAGKTTACPKCRTQLDISGFKPGQRIRCGACNTVLRIPGAEPAPVSIPVPAQSPSGPATGGGATQKVALGPPPAPAPRPAARSPASRPAAPAPAPPPPPPSDEKKDEYIGFAVAGEFEIVRKLGEGGYGVVYEASDRTLRRRVAVKLMLASRASNKEYVGKFLREAQTAAKITHPNIVAIHAVGFEPAFKTHYLAMEYVEGRTLHDILQERGPMDVEEAVDVISQCCRGLGVAHKMNIIHRDIKPGNIMITPSKGVKIADFGLAKQLDEDEQAKSMVIGTPFFMPPEQFEGKAKDGRTDIYALGVTFYYMLTMKRPFTGSTPAQILVAVMTREPTPIQELRPGLPDGVWKVVRKMIHRDLDQRYQNCEDIVEDLAKLRKPEEGEKIFCPECGVPNDVDASKCKGCSASMRERCPVCGAEEDVGVKFCGDCGANIPLEKEVKGLADEGKGHLDHGDFNKAIEKLHEAKEKSPDNSQVISLLREAEGRRDALDKERTSVSALLAAGDFDRAGQRLKAALLAFPNEERLIALQGDLERTRAAMRRGPGKFTVEALLKSHRYGEARERLMMSEGRTEELIELLRQAEQALGAVAERIRKARELDASGDASGAVAAWKQVLESSPENPEALERIRRHEEEKGAADSLLREAKGALDGGDPQGAERRLAAATGRSAADPRVVELLAAARAAAGVLASGVAAVRAGVTSGDFGAASGKLEALRGKFPKANSLPALEEEIRAARKAADVLQKAGKVKALAGSRRWAEARDAATELLSDDPENAEAKATLEKARAEMARAADLVAKAVAAEQAGRFEEAEAAFRDAGEILPGDPEAAEGRKRAAAAREKLAGLHREAEEARKSGDQERIAEALRKLVEAAPGDSAAAKELQRVEKAAAERMRELQEIEELLAAGEVEDAIAKARAFEKKRPEDPEGRELTAIGGYFLAARDGVLARVERLLAAEGREREAARLAQVALRIMPGDPKASALLAKARSSARDATP
jgi:tetratricopeptide (TPR) repeat protein